MLASKMPSRLGPPGLKVKEINIKEFFSKTYLRLCRLLNF
jgi:hypothetical protein